MFYPAQRPVIEMVPLGRGQLRGLAGLETPPAMIVEFISALAQQPWVAEQLESTGESIVDSALSDEPPGPWMQALQPLIDPLTAGVQVAVKRRVVTYAVAAGAAGLLVGMFVLGRGL